MNKITYEEREAVYEKALQTWGAEAQIMMAIEEMSELTKELCKHFRGNQNVEDIADEIADVTIMLEQLRLIFDLNDAVCEHMDMKILRLQSRLGMDHDPDAPGIPTHGVNAKRRRPQKRVTKKEKKSPPVCRYNSGVLCKDQNKCAGCGFKPRKAGDGK